MASLICAIQKFTRMPDEYGIRISSLTLVTDRDRFIGFMKKHHDIRVANNWVVCIKFGFINNPVPEKGAFIFAESMDAANDRNPLKGVPGLKRTMTLCAVVMSQCLNFGSGRPPLPEGFPGANINSSARIFTGRGFEFSVYTAEQFVPLYSFEYTIGNIQVELAPPRIMPKISNVVFMIPRLAVFFDELNKTVHSEEGKKVVANNIRDLTVNCNITPKQFLDNISALLHRPFANNIEAPFDALINQQFAINNYRNELGGGYTFPNYQIDFNDIFDEIAKIPLKNFIVKISKLVVVSAKDTEILAEAMLYY